MQESTKDLWAYYDEGYNVCVTINLRRGHLAI